ncbi:MAG: hypothetical protein LBL94_10330 [Prevotellaceae bacterium]|nr:hypothetical protein [Prevotellaceae bacterium]
MEKIFEPFEIKSLFLRGKSVKMNEKTGLYALLFAFRCTAWRKSHNSMG